MSTYDIPLLFAYYKGVQCPSHRLIDPDEYPDQLPKHAYWMLMMAP